MTKKEQKNIITKHVIEAVQKNFNVVEDFNDEEGRGYFTFAIEHEGIEYRFDMSRNDFSIISYKIKGEKGHQEALELEEYLDKFIENEIVMISIKEGIF